MAYTNRKFMFDLDMFKKFYEQRVVKWFNGPINLTNNQKQQARNNLAINAENVPYSNTYSQLTSTTVKGAVDEVNEKIEGNKIICELPRNGAIDGHYNDYGEVIENNGTKHYAKIVIGVENKLTVLHIDFPEADIDTLTNVLLYSADDDDEYPLETHVLNMYNTHIVFRTKIQYGMRLAVSCSKVGTPTIFLETDSIRKSIAQIETCYVSATDGDDLNDGLTKETPKCTIQAALDTLAKEIIILDASEYNEHLDVSQYEGKDLTIRASTDNLAVSGYGDSARPKITSYIKLIDHQLSSAVGDSSCRYISCSRDTINRVYKVFTEQFGGSDREGDDDCDIYLIIDSEHSNEETGDIYPGVERKHKAVLHNESRETITQNVYNKLQTIKGSYDGSLNKVGSEWFYANAESEGYVGICYYDPTASNPSSVVTLLAVDEYTFGNIRNLCLDGIDFLYTSLRISHCNNVRITNCKVKDSKWSALMIHEVNYAYISNTKFLGALIGGVQVYQGATVRLQNCYFYRCPTAIYSISQERAIQNLFVDDCIIEYCEGRGGFGNEVYCGGIYAEDTNVVANNVIIHHVGGSGIKFIKGTYSTNGLFRGCKIYNVEAIDGVSTPVGGDIETTSSEQVRFVDCAVKNILNGIAFKGSNTSDVILKDCYCKNVGQETSGPIIVDDDKDITTE